MNTLENTKEIMTTANSWSPPGYEEVWVEEDAARWRMAPPGHKCRFMAARKGCGRPAIVALRRSNGWWYYCEEHMYGRREHNGIIEEKRFRKLKEEDWEQLRKEAGLENIEL